MKKLRAITSITADAAKGFVNDRCLKLSASLSYYTVFAIGPMLVILIAVAGIFLGPEAVSGRLFAQINDIVGNKAASHIQEVIANSQLASNSNLPGFIVGVVLLVVGATTVFAEIQDSINFIWSIKAKPARGWLKWLKNRVLSFSLLISCSFLLLVSLVLNSLLDVFSEYLQQYFNDQLYYIFYVLNFLMVLGVITLLFTIVFKVLPDGKVNWGEARMGALFTATLFMLGKFLISFYLKKNDVGATYGAAGSIIIILTWVYYTSAILFFGAEFTKAWSLYFGDGIEPDSNAVFIVKREVKEIPQAVSQTQVELITEKEKEITEKENAANNKHE